MYALSKSILEPVGEYRVEMYHMAVLEYDISVSVDLKIFGEGLNELYVAEYVITRAIDEKITFGSCMNQPTKEATIELVEAIVIEAMEEGTHHWE